MIGAIESALERVEAREADATALFAAAAEDYIRHLRNHIIKEDDILFPMAGRILSPADLAHLEKQFAQVDHDLGLDHLKRLEEFARELARD